MTDWADTIARECIGNGMGDSDVCRLFAEALRAEREASAQVAEGELMEVYSLGKERVAKAIAAAIRARGEDET